MQYSPGKTNIEGDCQRRNPVLEVDENVAEKLKNINLIKLQDTEPGQESNQKL